MFESISKISNAIDIKYDLTYKSCSITIKEPNYKHSHKSKILIINNF